MQAIMETIFDTAYLIAAMILGVLMLRGARGRRQFVIFGIMTVFLAFGDAFHLVPRVIALNTNGVENHVAALGFGTLIASITMTVFYVLLYHVWRLRYGVKGKGELTAAVYGLAAVRIILCLLPQNDWLSPDAPASWGIYRNIPFVLLGALIIALFAARTRDRADPPFRFMPLAIILSFAFYIPVVLWADAAPWVGVFMLPKTCAYIAVVLMGRAAMKKDRLP